jgi:hypothetical protein
MPDLDRITATSEQALDAPFNVGLVNRNRQSARVAWRQQK